MSDLSLCKTCLVTAKSHKKRAHEYKREALEEYAKGDVGEYNRLISDANRNWLTAKFNLSLAQGVKRKWNASTIN